MSKHLVLQFEFIFRLHASAKNEKSNSWTTLILVGPFPMPGMT